MTSKSKGSGSGSGSGKIKMDSSFRWNDGEVVRRHRSAHWLRAWIPAFAGMTVVWFTKECPDFTAWIPAGVPELYRPGSRLSPG